MVRINARLEPEYIDKLEILKRQEHLTTTEVIKKALACYYEMKKRDNSTKIQQLLESDTAGINNAISDIDLNMKALLAAQSKNGARVNRFETTLDRSNCQGKARLRWFPIEIILCYTLITSSVMSRSCDVFRQI